MLNGLFGCLLQVHQDCELLETLLFQEYEQHSEEAQEKLQRASDCLERISMLEKELHSFKHALGILHQEVNP